MSATPPLPWRDVPGFDGLYGLQIDAISDEEVAAVVPVRDDLRQATGAVHGGVIAALAESTASLATGLAVREQGATIECLATHASFLHPVRDGTLHATARRRHRGRSTWVWEVDVADDDGRLCAAVRVTIAIRDQPPR